MMALLALLALLSAPELQAHESRPAYLEIEQTAPDQYSMLWRTPVLSGMRLPVAVRLPDDIRTDGEPIEQQLSDSLIERRVLKTGPAGLDGQRIEFAGLQATITDVLVRLQWLDGRQQTTLVRPAQAWLVISSRQSGWGVAGEYTRLGVEHILYGVDHLLFVLTLLLITRGIMPLVKTITAFTVAHSITLALAVFGFVQVPQRPVEAVIALSIAFVAAEIINARRGAAGIAARAPWVVAFAFGLLHGLGFAGALNEIGLPQGQIPLALLFFNIGVEAGQLLFVAVVLGFMASIRRIGNALPRWLDLVPPYVIGSVAMLWVFQRVAAL